MSDNSLSNDFSQGNFSFWDDVVLDGTLPKQLLQDDEFPDNTNLQGLLHDGCSEKDVFPVNGCGEINFTECMMELDNYGEEILPIEDSSAINCETPTYFDLNIPDLLQPENYGLDETMMNCVNVFQMNDLSVFPGFCEDSTEGVDDVEQWSCCSPNEETEPVTEESLIKQDNDCFQVSDCGLSPVTPDEFSKRGNAAEQISLCSSPVKTNKQASNEIPVTEDLTVSDDALQVNNFSQLFGPLSDCSERGDSIVQSSNCSSKKATNLMVDEVSMEQDSGADDDSSNGESVIYDFDIGESLTLGPTSQQHLSCFPNEDSKSNVVVSNPVDVSGPKTSLSLLNSNMTKRMTADCNASKPKCVVLHVVRKPNSDSGTKMLTRQTDYTDVLENTSQPSFVSRNRSTGDESDSAMDNLPHNLNKSALQARINREKKKAYIAGLEKQIGTMKKEKADLERKVGFLEEKSAALDDQVMYLKSVLANDSVLAKLISNINGPKTAELSSSSVMGKKRKLGEDCDDRRTKVHKSSGASSGICLHVSDERLSLELCHHCAQSSAIANRTL